MNYDKMKKPVLDIISNKKYQWIATFAVLFIVLMMSSSIRLSNWDLLTDSITGEKIPLALDPFYFLRIAETIVETDGVMPEFDEMRSPSTNVVWHPEILPKTIVGIYYVAKVFSPDILIRDVGIASPVIFFIMGIIVFFFLSYTLSKKKSVALLATTFLAFAPSYLYRTMAGFSDHEAIGMIAIFSFFLVYALALKNFEKSWKHVWVYSVLSGFMVAFVLATWGGAVTFVLTTMPFAFFMYWFFAKKDDLKSIFFYGLLLLSSILSPLIFGYPIDSLLNRFVGSYGLLIPFVLAFILIDFGFSRMRNIKLRNIKFEEYKTLYSFGATALIGLIGLKIIGKSIIEVFREVWVKLINPFGNLSGGRLGATVAENAQPYLMDWIGQSGKFVFWLFVLGVFIIGIDFALKIRNKKSKFLFIFSWIVVVSGILFSRISSASLFNGTNFVSQSFYLLSLIFFGAVLLITANKNEFKVDSSTILILAVLFFTLINGRSATRVFFLIAPFVAFSAAYFVGRIYDYVRESNEEILKIVLWGVFVLAIVGSAYSVVGYYENVSGQAKYTGPSANAQWQSAMEWVRGNTSEGDVFVHWWDYGYWVQSLGERPTVTDGGHSGGSQADHYIGRYVLTTPNPESALSYMKTWNVSYLLIDQTDLGKYPAYSRIGGGEEDSQDRYSAIPIMLVDDKQTRETANGTIIVFSGGSYLFEDIIYNDNGKKIFLPAGKAAIVGIVVNLDGNMIKQPEAIYIYNNIQTRIPVRYIYINGELVDFKSGLDVIVDIIPAFSGSSINQMGAVIYLSQKVSKSLFARLFLLDDVFNEYETLELVHIEDNPVVASLKSQGAMVGDFVYYQGFRGPIKIWDVFDIPEEIGVIEEFKEPLDGKYARFDEVFY